MEENIKADISILPKYPMLNLANALDKYMKSRILAENPTVAEHDEMYDFIQKKKNWILGLWYLPLSKHDRRVTSKLYDILSTEIYINEKIMTDEYTEQSHEIVRKYEDIENTKKELLMILFGNIYTSTYVETKILATFTPQEITTFLDIFEESVVSTIEKRDTQERNNEIAAWITGDEDETDVAATFYEKVIEHHEINNPIGIALESLFYSKNISHNNIYKKTIEHANIIRAYFKKYPEIFIIAFCPFLNHTQMHQAFEAIFPEKYNIPDSKKYIDYRYWESLDE